MKSQSGKMLRAIGACWLTCLALAVRPTAAAPCSGDADEDGQVGFADLLLVLSEWGPCLGCSGDVNGDHQVEFADLITVLSNWGPCLDVMSTRVTGLPLAQYPHFDYVRTFNEGEPIWIAIDPHRFPVIDGATATVYVVEARLAAEWDADPLLVDARPSGAQIVTFAGPDVQDSTILLAGTLDGDGGLDFGVGYDLVVDVDQNGLLGPGDFIDGRGDEAGLYVVGDITAAGPLPTTTHLYSGGVLLAQRLTYPTDIAALGPRPLVVIGHGNGHEYNWYDYLQQHLASYGFITMSHQNETVPGIETASTTTLTNTDYLLANQDIIHGGALDGLIDSHRIIWIGHSRGGEGVVRAYDRLVDGSYVPDEFTATDIVLVSSIAPTDFLGLDGANPHDVDYHLVYGAADGDVSGAPDCDVCQSFHVYERAAGRRAATYVHGADHNDFNCCGFEDFCWPATGGPCDGDLAIGREEAQRVAKASFLAVIMHMVEGSVAAGDFLQRQPGSLKPLGLAPETVVRREYRDPAGASTFVIDDFEAQISTSTSSSGGAVIFDVSHLVEDRLNDADTAFAWTPTDPMNGMTRGRADDETSGVVFDWSGTGFLEFVVVAAARDCSGREFLSFRACQGTRHPNTTAEPGSATFTVTLRDVGGATSSVNIGAYAGGIGEPFARSGFGAGIGWQNEFETVRIRLTDFTANGSGLDLTDIEAVRFDFGPGFGSSQGRIGLDDVELINE